jgi:hypothetical protein
MIIQLAMNTFRTFFLIIVSVIQISGMFTNSIWKSLHLTEFTAKAYMDVKHEASYKMTSTTSDLHLNKKTDFQRLNCKETSTKSKVQSENILNNGENLPVVKASDNSQQTIKSSGVMSQISFGRTVTAELF